MTSSHIPNVISSPELVSGHTHCEKQDGRTTGQSGQAVVRASLSARQAREKGLLTSGTYGPRSFTSSSSASLTLSLVNRLQARTDSSGSTLYKLTWKQRTTPQQHLIYALRASVHRTSDRDSTGWPTPTANDYKGSGPTVIRKDGKNRMFNRLDYATEQGLIRDSGKNQTGSFAAMASGGS